MLYIVKELPEGVELSPRLRERADFFLSVQSFGVSFYIPATPKIRRLLCLDKHGRDVKPDMRRRWWNYDKADALRDIVCSLELQVRDVVLTEIEGNVTRTLLNEMRGLMRPKVRSLIDAQAVPKLLGSGSKKKV